MLLQSVRGAIPGRSARRWRDADNVVVLLGLAALLVVVVVVALCLGPIRIPFLDTARVLLGDLGLPIEAAPGRYALVVQDIRLPRVLLSVLAGAALALVGAVMQALFRNPLAEPGVIGVSSGAAVGAVAVLATGAGFLGRWTLPCSAFLGALVALMVVQAIALVRRDTSPATLLLAGIALNALLGAVIGALISAAQDSQTVRGVMFWLQGDLSAASWADVRLIVLPVFVGAALTLTCTRDLNVLMLGDEQARAAGVNVVPVRRFLLVVASILTGAVVSVTGVIGFVGLVVPHVVRLTVGPDHRLLLPASALLGATFLTVADLIARLLLSPVSLQTGVVTALLGSPVFLALILRSGSGRTTGR